MTRKERYFYLQPPASQLGAAIDAHARRVDAFYIELWKVGVQLLALRRINVERSPVTD